MTLPEPGVVIDLDGSKQRERIARLVHWCVARARGTPPMSHEDIVKFGTDQILRAIPDNRALIERHRALEGGGGEGGTSARVLSQAHNAAREADASTLVSDAASPVLEALRECRDHIARNYRIQTGWEGVVAKADAAIAKATGQ